MSANRESPTRPAGRMSRRVKFALAATAACIVAAGVLSWRATREIAVQTIPVLSDVEVRVFAIGSVEAQVVSKVGFQIAGKLNELAVDQGDVVGAGGLLAKLDDTAQRAKLMKSEVTLRQAAANLAKSQAQGERASTSFKQKQSVNARRQMLLTRGSVAPEAAEDTQAGEDIARSDLRVAEADTAIAAVLRDDADAQHHIEAVAMEQHELHAPFDARVIARHKELGSIANAGEPVFTLIAADSIWVRAYVDEALAGGLRIGQTAFVRLRSEPDRVVEAEIVRIDQENDRTTEERRVYVRCRACNPQHQIRYLGEQAEVEIVKGVAAGRFVPLRHVEGFDGRSGVVWVIDRGRLAKRHVRFGERLLDGRIQILSELPEQIAVVTDTDGGLREGRAARPASSNGP